MSVVARLIGGRFDGERHEILYAPEAIVVARDQAGQLRIGDLAENPPPFPSRLHCETYELDEEDDETAVYRRFDAYTNGASSTAEQAEQS